MPQTSSPPVAAMTVGDIMKQAEEMAPDQNEAAAPIKPEENDPAATPITVVETRKEAEKMDLKPMDLPNDPAKIHTFPFDPKYPKMIARNVLAMKTVQMIREKRSVDAKEYQMIGNILKAISSIKTFTADNVDMLQSKWIMNCILGESENTRGPYEFPQSFQDVAVANLARMDQELEVSEAPDEKPLTTITNTSRKRSRDDTAPPQSTSRQQPNTTDPAYQSIMWNITVTDGRTRKYSLTNKSAAIPCNRFGHNGLTVGQWFPFRICALNAGAHGATQAGIAGSEKIGAFSIVVSSDYDELDKDNGVTLYYSGSNSSANEDPATPVLTHATQALRRSYRDARLIRVLRTAGGKWHDCPAKGIRYDGLYRIISEGVAQNMKGGAYMRFKLLREAGQPAIDLSRPTQVEKDVFERLKSSI